jgi:hypothetical protein
MVEPDTPSVSLKNSPEILYDHLVLINRLGRYKNNPSSKITEHDLFIETLN